MTKKRGHKAEMQEVAQRLRAMESPEIRRYVDDLHRRFAKYALPAGEARKIVDKAMGDHMLTKELYQMREDREQELCKPRR